MPTRSKPSSRARALTSLAVHDFDGIGLLLHGHCRSVNLVRNCPVHRLSDFEQCLEARPTVGIGLQQRAMLRRFGALVSDARIDPAADDDAGASQIAEIVRIKY